MLGIGGSSDGKGKGITAPNPVGQRLAVERAWQLRRAWPPRRARSSRATARRPASVTSSRSRHSPRSSAPPASRRGVDRARIGEVEHRPPEGRCWRCRAVQSGHGSARQGAAAEPQLPPPNPNVDFGRLAASRSTPSCVDVGQRLRQGSAGPASARSASAAPTSTPCSRSTCPDAIATGGSAAGVVRRRRRSSSRIGRDDRGGGQPQRPRRAARWCIGATDETLARRLACARWPPRPPRARRPAPPADADLARARAGRDRLRRRRRAGRQGRQARSRRCETGQPRHVEGATGRRASSSAAAGAGKVAFLYTGQGSQYVNMLKDLRDGNRSSPTRSPRPTG